MVVESVLACACPAAAALKLAVAMVADSINSFARRTIEFPPALKCSQSRTFPETIGGRSLMKSGRAANRVRISLAALTDAHPRRP
jgi:hypothetical protein